jgi:polar amino acid transport system permease protein
LQRITVSRRLAAPTGRRLGDLRATEDVDDASTAGLAVLALLAAQGIHFLVTNSRFGWKIVRHYLFASSIMHGLAITIELTAICGCIGVVLGIVVALARLSPFRVIRSLAVTYVWFFRSVPVLVQLLFWFNLGYLLPDLGIGLPFGPIIHQWSSTTLIQPLTAAIVGFSFHEGACDGEIVRAGILAVSEGQVDAAKALGFRPRGVFWRVVFPQAARITLPPLGTQFINLLKGTSLVSVIALSDLLFSAENIYGVNLEVIPLLLVASIWYLLLVAVMSFLQSRLERRLSGGYKVDVKTKPSSLSIKANQIGEL